MIAEEAKTKQSLAAMRPAAFLDRDGVIVREVGYITRTDQLELYPGAAEAVAELNRRGYLTIVVTNQSAVARKMISEPELQSIHESITAKLAEQNAYLDAIYYCPHFPPEDGEAEEKPYRVHCGCRKPEPGMIQQACRDFLIDVPGSFLVGDRESDIVLGHGAGMTTILLESGYGIAHYRGVSGVKPDMICRDLMEAVIRICGKENNSKQLPREENA